MDRRVLLLFVGVCALVAIVLWSFGFFREPVDDWYRDIRRGHWIWWGARKRSRRDPREDCGGQRRSTRRSVRHHTDLRAGKLDLRVHSAGGGAKKRGGGRLRAGDTEVARELHHQASVYFGLAKYPGFGFDPNEVYAHKMQLEMYEASQSASSAIAFSVVEIPVRDGVIRGYLHQPADHSDPLPLVIGTNGIDVFKAEFGPIVDALIEQNISFFAFDMPSAGEESEFPLKPDNDEIYIEVMRYLQQMPTIDASRIALWGVSFGGNPVVRAAQKSPTGLRGAVIWCGPIHDVFQISEFQLSLVADMYVDVLRYRLHMPTAENSALVEAMRGFSLIDAGLIRPGKVA